MVRIDKMYFTVKEVARRWGVRKCDIAYLVENDELKVSTRLEGARLERGTLEVANGQSFKIPYQQDWFSGILDLRRSDAYRVFRDGQARIVHFDAEEQEYAAVVEPAVSVDVRLEHLVIRRCERDRVEACHGDNGNTVADGIAFQHDADYRNVRLGSTEMALGAVQAQVVRALHEAALTDQPWLDGKRVLSEAGATSMRMSDVFKSKKGWRDLIVSDGRGRYRLRLNPE